MLMNENQIARHNRYFTVRHVPYAGAPWIYAEATKVLLVVFGLTEVTKRLVLIRQYRPPMKTYVLSAPMGCFPDAPISDLLTVAAAEAESETGHRVTRIQYLLTFARSPGLTTELARCFVASYAEEAGSRSLHADEQIEVQYVARESIGTVFKESAIAKEVIDSSILLCDSWLLEKMQQLQT
jgi:hypothetical protein